MTEPRKVIGEWEGLPFRIGPSQGYPTLKSTDPDFKQPSLVKDAQIKIFDLSKPGDLQEYQEVWDKIAKGQAVRSAEERQFCTDIQNWRVFLRWANLAYELPKGSVTYANNSTIYGGSAG